MNTRFASVAYGNLVLTILGIVGAFASKPSDSALFPVSLTVVMVTLVVGFVLTMYAFSRYNKSDGQERKEWLTALVWTVIPIFVTLFAVVILRSLVPAPEDPDVTMDRKV